MSPIFNLSSYQFSLYALPVLLVGASLAGLGLFVFVHERFSQVGITFLVFTLTVGLYLTGEGINYCAVDTRVAMFWIKIGHIGLLFIPSTALFLAVIHLQLVSRYRFQVAGAFVLSAILVLSLFFADLLLKEVRHFFWGYYGQYGSLGLVTLLFVVAVMAFVLNRYRQEYRLSKTEKQKMRFRGIFIAFSIGTLAAVDVIPTFGIAFYPFGYLPMFLFLLIMARVITQYRLSDVSPESAAHRVLELMQGAVIVVDCEDRIKVVNRVVLEMLGYEKSALLNNELGSVISVKSALQENT